MNFNPVSVGVVLDGGIRIGDTPAGRGAIIRLEAGDVPRKLGPCYEVSGGHVWRESTLDAKGRDIAVWWWARRSGARVKILRACSTRNKAAALLRRSAYVEPAHAP